MTSVSKTAPSTPAPIPADLKTRIEAANAKAQDGIKTVQDLYGVGKTAESRHVLSADGKTAIVTFVSATATKTICAEQNDAMSIATDAIKAVAAKYSAAAVAGTKAAITQVADDRDANTEKFNETKAAANALEPTEPCAAEDGEKAKRSSKVRSDN